MNTLKLPKWAQDIIRNQRNKSERLERELKASRDKTEKQSEEIQALLDIVKNLKPTLFDRWNHGVSLAELLQESKAP